MVESIERNDIDLSKLFTWGKEIELFDVNNVPVLKVYMRIVGDENLNRARVYGLRKSAELRKLLRTDGTDERLAYIPDKDLVNKDNLIEQLLLFKMREHTGEAISNMSFNIPKEPDSDASLEELEKYQKEVDEFPQKREEQLRKYIMDQVEIDRKKYQGIDLDTLLREYENGLINQLCEAEMILRFREMCVFFGTFKDKDYKNKLFNSIEDIYSLTTEVKDQLIEAYMSLEIGGENLKNLPEVVQ